MPITEIKEEIRNKLKFNKKLLAIDSLVLKEDFTNGFKVLIDFVKNIVKILNKKYTETINRVDRRYDSLEVKLNTKINQVKDGIDGKDGAMGLTGAVGATGEGIQGINGADGSPDTPKLIRDKLEFLKKGDRLEIFAIEDLEDRLAKLEERPLGGKGGGGFSYIAMDRHFIENKTLGTGDGSNKDFTLPKAPNPVSSLHVFIGSGSMFLTDDFTLSGTTVSFITAPPKKAKVRASLRA